MRKRAAGQSFSADSTKSEKVATIDACFGPWLKRVLGSVGSTDTACSESVGVARQTFARCLDAGKSPRVSYLYMLPEPVRVAVAADIAGEGYTAVCLPTASSSASTIDAVARVHRASASVTARGMQIVAAGHCSRAVGAAMASDIDDAIAGLLELKALATSAMNEGVVGVIGKAGGM